MSIQKIIDGNEAAAHIAYKVSEVAAIYPITPSTPMGESSDDWSAKGQKNIWGTIPQVVELQSEGGASGALHGAIQTGALATTFTASQGLLLMLPNMYKIAGELTPTVIHVAARSLAAQGLSIFGDHQDVMSARTTGFAMISSSSVQEAQDFALIAHAATLESRIPFMHFFDGFRTSHELNMVDMVDDDIIKEMIDDDLVFAHRERALRSDKPVLRGTAQNPDIYFQAREASNNFYNETPKIVEKYLAKFAKLTNREYHLVDYFGDDEAEEVIVIMCSGAQAVKEAIENLNKQDRKFGLVVVHLYRPFPKEALLKAIPNTVKKIAVLDRTKEPGSLGEPMYLDVVTAYAEALSDGELEELMPIIIGGRYGLSSKEFTPAMVKGVYDELLKDKPKNHFTIGINDDVTHTSLSYDPNFITEDEKVTRAMFFGLGSDGTVGANKNSIKIIGGQEGWYSQGYFVYDSKKSGSRTTSHLRFGHEPINSTYLIQSANFVACHQFNFTHQINVLEKATKGATFLINSPYSLEDTWTKLSKEIQTSIIEKDIQVYVIDALKVARRTGMGNRINTIMQTCFFGISDIIPKEQAIAEIKAALKKTYSSKGHEIVEKNCNAVDAALENMHKLEIPNKVDANAKVIPLAVTPNAPEFVKEVLAKMMADEGDSLPVSALPADGTYPVGTTQYEKRNVSDLVAIWDKDSCVQCGRCNISCPQSVIRSKHVNNKEIASFSDGFKSASFIGKGYPDELYTLQVYLEDCTGCNLCVESCPVRNEDGTRAINLGQKDPIIEQERRNIALFESLKENDRSKLNANIIRGCQYMEPLFEFSSACSGCGETPYLHMLTQLFGDRMMVANATGCSSIYGGNLPTTPWTKNKDGRGPAWSNSLFEDNAEFGFGYKLTMEKHAVFAEELLISLRPKIKNNALVDRIEANIYAKEEVIIHEQYKLIDELKQILKRIDSPEAKQLLSIIHHLAHHSVWMIGGDGWSYDIGYGGLDHVLASGRDVNVLVLNTQSYSNTGGQASKATPLSAVAKFAASGKDVPRKDLAMIAMTYGHIYVAQIALEANPQQALHAMREAEAFNGPSLIIAYSHCIAQGINLEDGVSIQKIAVETGFWPLFRYNPALEEQGHNPMSIDSHSPRKSFKEFAMRERRFKNLLTANPKQADNLFSKAQSEINSRWKNYLLIQEMLDKEI